MANTVNSEEWYKEHKGLNQSLNFSLGLDTSSFSINAKAEIPKLELENVSPTVAQSESYKKNKKRKENIEIEEDDDLDDLDDLEGLNIGGLGASLGQIKGAIDTAKDAPNALAGTASSAVGSVVGTAIGSSGALVGQVSGIKNLSEGTVEMAADLVQSAIQDITDHAMQTLAKNITAIITPPKLSDITSRAAKRMQKYISDNAGTEIKNLMADAEKLAETSQNSAVTDCLGNVTDAMNETVSKINKKITDGVGVISKEVNNLKEYSAEGQDWLQGQVSNYTDNVKFTIDEYINNESKSLLKTKKKAIKSIGDALGTGLGKAAVALLTKAAKDKTDKVREKKQQVIINAKAKIGKALLNLMAKIGG